MFATSGKYVATLQELAADRQATGGKLDQVGEVCCDLSKAFISGVQETLAEAKITFDEFHVM